MSFLAGSLGNVAAFCVGTAAVALGAPPAGLIEASVGAGGLIGFILGRGQQFGPECDRVRNRIQKDIFANYQQLISGSDGDFTARADLLAADAALKETLGLCFIDRKALAASAVTPAGFPTQAVIVVIRALGEANPELFGPDRNDTLAYRFARDVIQAGIEAAVADPEYYRKLEPDLMIELAKNLGSVRESVAKIQLAVQRQGDEQERQGELLRTSFASHGILLQDIAANMPLLQKMAAKMGIRGGGEALNIETSWLEHEPNATRSDLVALLSDIVGHGISSDQVAPALATAKTKLEKSRTELEQLRSLANEVPEIESHIAAARAALDNRDQIGLAAAQAAIRAANTEYRRAVTQRRHTEAINMARLSEAEASIALARSDFLEAARLFGEAAELSEAEKQLAAERRFKQADALYQHGIRFSGLTSLEQAVDAYSAALTVYTKKDMPGP